MRLAAALRRLIHKHSENSELEINSFNCVILYSEERSNCSYYFGGIFQCVFLSTLLFTWTCFFAID